MTTKRTEESQKAADVLKKILTFNPTVPGLKPRDRRAALEFAILLLEARAVDGEGDKE